MESAAEVLAKLGRTEPTDVKVLVYDEDARSFLAKGSVKLGKTLPTEPTPLFQPIGRPKRKARSHQVLPLAIVGVLALTAWGARAQLSSILFGNPAEGAGSSETTSAPEIMRRALGGITPAPSTIGADGTDCSKVRGANYFGQLSTKTALQFGTVPGRNGEFTYWGLPDGVIHALYENGGVSFGKFRPGGKSCLVDIWADGQFRGTSYRMGVTCEITKYEQETSGIWFQSLEACKKNY